MLDKITIIVPIYNAEKYLRKCIESIINQTYKNLEIILVDDGSTDSSRKIIDEYQKKDKRIITKHIKNSGVSNARNIGISIASGDYIGFVDSDDYIESTMYELLYNSILDNKCDISICNIFFENENGMLQKEFHYTNNILTKRQYLNAIFYNRSIQGYSCNKLYSKKIIKNKDIIFDKNAVVLEDDLFNIEIITKNNKLLVSYIDNQLYHYVNNDVSVSNSEFNINKLSYFYVRSREIDLLTKYGYNVNHLKIDYCTAFIRAKILMKKNKIKKNDFFLESYNNYKKYKKEICIYKLDFKMKLKYLIVKYFPYIYNLKILYEKNKIKGGDC